MSQTTIVVAEETTAVQAPAEGETGHTTDATTFPSQIFWLVVFFGLLYLLMSRLALPKMAALIANRRRTMEADLAKASALKTETETAIQAYEKALADARAKAQGIAAETRAKMASEMDAERAALEKKIAAKTAEAESRIASAKAQAMQEVGEVAADTAAEIVSELTGATVSKAEAVKAIAGLKA
jgi:F-type H+-transporting ATPase subunit b